MNIRPATPADLPALMESFARARRFMAEHGNPGQWPASYPDGALMREQIDRGVCYVCEADGERTLTVTKKDPLWKRARKIRWGERI